MRHHCIIVIKVGRKYYYCVIVFRTNARVDHASKLVGFRATACCAGFKGLLPSFGFKDSSTARRMSCFAYSTGVPPDFSPTKLSNARACELRSFFKSNVLARIFSCVGVESPFWASDSAFEISLCGQDISHKTETGA